MSSRGEAKILRRSSAESGACALGAVSRFSPLCRVALGRRAPAAISRVIAFPSGRTLVPLGAELIVRAAREVRPGATDATARNPPLRFFPCDLEAVPERDIIRIDVSKVAAPRKSMERRRTLPLVAWLVIVNLLRIQGTKVSPVCAKTLLDCVLPIANAPAAALLFVKLSRRREKLGLGPTLPARNNEARAVKNENREPQRR